MAQANEVDKRAKENEGAKEVEPDGHCKATHSHELHLNELAFVGSMKVVP